MTNPNWNCRPLGELFEIGAGKTMSAAARTGVEKVPFLRTSNVLWDDIDLSTLDEMSMSAQEFAEKSLKAGDLLVCEGGEIGRAAVWDGRIEAMSFQNHLHRLRPLRPNVEPRFYVYFLQSAFTQLGIFEGAGNRTTIPNLSRNRLAALDVPHPPVDEQRAIANSLAELRRSMKVHDRATTIVMELKASAMRELLTRGLRGEPQKETEIGPVPHTWTIETFSDIREWLQYGTSTRCKSELATYPVLRIPNVEAGRVDTSDVKYCDLPRAEADKYLLREGDLLFIRTNGVLERLGSTAVYQGRPEHALFASYLIRARLKDGIDPRYVSYFYSSERGTSLVAGRATPASDGKYNLNTGTIDSLLLPVPPTIEEQREIVAVLEAIERKIDLHREKSRLIEDLFKGLLHKLMTGEIRVSDLDLSVLSPTTEAITA
jgi:type I restriction enzyme, S subunit